MLYFFGSTSKKDKMTHPMVISTKGGANKALGLAIINFAKNSMFGSPRLINV